MLTLAPATSVVRNLREGLAGVMPEAEGEIERDIRPAERNPRRRRLGHGHFAQLRDGQRRGGEGARRGRGGRRVTDEGQVPRHPGVHTRLQRDGDGVAPDQESGFPTTQRDCAARPTADELSVNCGRVFLLGDHEGSVNWARTVSVRSAELYELVLEGMWERGEEGRPRNFRHASGQRDEFLQSTRRSLRDRKGGYPPCPARFSVTGVDFSPQLVSAANSKAGRFEGEREGVLPEWCHVRSAYHLRA